MKNEELTLRTDTATVRATTRVAPTTAATDAATVGATLVVARQKAAITAEYAATDAATDAATVVATFVVARQKDGRIPVCGRPQGSPLQPPAHPSGRTHAHGGLRTIFFIFLSLFFVSCTDDLAPALDDDAADVVTVTAGGRLRITPDAVTATRTTISGRSTTFDDGDIVGCIICTKDDSGNYQYKATSKWKYNSTYRTFLIERYWTYGTSSTELCAYEPYEGDTKNFFISYEEDTSDAASSSDDSDVGGGYTLISEDAGTLYLFFYRPYTDPLETTDERPFLTYWPQVTEDETVTYLMGFAGPGDSYTFSATVTKGDGSDGTTTETGTLNEYVKCFSWEKYPIFINLDQSVTTTTGDDGTSSSTAYGLEVSDGLSAQYLGGVSSSTTEVLRLTFAKQAATIRVLATSTISEAYLINGQQAETVVQDGETLYVYTEAPIIAGNLVNIKSASDVSWDDNTSHSLYTYRQIQGSDQITGAVYEPTFDYTAPSGTVDITSAARFHLPPQDDFHGVLKYKLSDDDNYSYLNLDGLGDNTLEAGTRYTVNLFNIDDQYLYIDTKSTYITNGSYLTLSSESTGALVTGSCSSSSTTYKINGTTISYYYKMTNGTGEYLGIYAPTTMTLTFYLVNDSSTPSVVIFETDEDYSGTTLYSTPTLETAKDDNSTTVLKATVQLEEGYYRVRRSGGNCYLLYATLTM